MTEQEAKDAMHRVDRIIAGVNMPRQDHLLLAQDLRQIQDRVALSFDLRREIECLQASGVDDQKEA